MTSTTKWIPADKESKSSVHQLLVWFGANGVSVPNADYVYTAVASHNFDTIEATSGTPKLILTIEYTFNPKK